MVSHIVLVVFVRYNMANFIKVHNLKQAKVNKKVSISSSTSTPTQPIDDVCKIVSDMRRGSADFTKAVTIFKDHFISIHCTDQQINDVVRFCCNGNSVFRVDTTFEIVDNFWVTDTSFSNESLICERGAKAPEFPGPFMLHFKKDTFTYQAFAAHLVMLNPMLTNIKKFGTDMDQALIGGLHSVFDKADSLVCIQHMMERDAVKLSKLGATSNVKQRVLADIYGSKQDQHLQLGLADAIDEEDFMIKLESLREIWEPLVAGFHEWFDKKRAEIFKLSVINSAKDRISIDDVFYNNRLEVFYT